MRTIGKRIAMLFAAVMLEFVTAPQISSRAAVDYLYTNSDTGFSVTIYDEADLLTDSEEAALVDVMIPLTEYGCIGFASVNTNNTSVQYCAEEISHNSFGRMPSQTLFFIDMQNRQIFIYSDGANYRTITDAKADIITDNIYTYASAGDYYRCAYEGYVQMKKVLSGGRIAQPLRYITSALLSILIAMLICFFIINANSKLRKPAVDDILGPAAKNLSLGPVKAVSKGTTKKYSPVSSSSGGSSGGGGSHSGGGGGGHSGGGGGHSF